MSFVIEFFLTIATKFFNNDWIFINHDLFFRENILYNFTVPNFQNK